MFWQKLLSRKLIVAVVSFISVNIAPNLSSDAQAKWSAFIAVAYLIGQGIADHGAGTSSQGSTSVTGHA
jgi:hypothetical protein